MKLIVAVLILLCASQSHAQDNSNQDSSIAIPSTYLSTVSKRIDKINEGLEKVSAATLSKWYKRERKLFRKLARKDSIKAKSLVVQSKLKWEELQQSLKVKNTATHYISSLDTLSTSLQFLASNRSVSMTLEQQKVLVAEINKVKNLQGNFNSTEAVKAYLKERRQALKESLGRLLPKDLKRLNKQAYYYAQEVARYKETLKDKKKVEKKALELLTKTKAYRDFFRRNSELAKLFRLPGGGEDGEGGSPSALSLQGLQTRASVSQALTARFGASPEALSQLREQVASAQGELNALKAKAQSLSQGSFGNGEGEMPEGFKPNNQKTKTFLERLEYGANIQSVKGTSFLPVTSDLGLSVGYKLSDKGAIGIGGSYKLGWGRSLRDLELTSQGIGIRSYVDYKLKGAFFLAGGYEMNYRSAFHSITQLQGYSSWQRSGLVGVSKKYKAGKKLKGNMQLLWDFLSYQQIPRTQAIVFRIGYSIK
jgi:hypothetical protein